MLGVAVMPVSAVNVGERDAEAVRLGLHLRRIKTRHPLVAEREVGA